MGNIKKFKPMIKNQSASQVLIVIRGGTIQGVFSSEKNLRVKILDYDEDEFVNNKSAEAEFEIGGKNLFELNLH